MCFDSHFRWRRVRAIDRVVEIFESLHTNQRTAIVLAISELIGYEQTLVGFPFTQRQHYSLWATHIDSFLFSFYSIAMRQWYRYSIVAFNLVC